MRMYVPVFRVVLFLSFPVGMLSIVSCGDMQPAVSQADLTTSRSGAAAEQGWTRGTLFNDHTFFVACLGESVRFSGLVEYASHEVTTGSGIYELHIHYGPNKPGSPEFTGVGQTTGTVFTTRYGVNVNVMTRLVPGEVETVIENDVFIGPGGQKLLVSSMVHLTVNANGELTVLNIEPFTIECAK